MIEKSVYKIFIRFLKETNLYVKYFNNIKNTEIGFYDLSKNKIYELVGYNEELTDIYDWSETEEGHEFWCDVDEEWKNLISHINPSMYNFKNCPNGILKKKRIKL